MSMMGMIRMGLHRYLYANANPLVYIDPYGQAASDLADKLDKKIKQLELLLKMAETIAGDDANKEAMATAINSVSSATGYTDLLRFGEGTANTVGYFEKGGFDNALLGIGEISKDVYRGATLGAGLTGLAEGTGLLRSPLTKNKQLVIGKMEDLSKAGAITPNETVLNLPNKGTPKLNWKQNYGQLRKVMRVGNPIRDATVDATGTLRNNTGFLRAERYTLQDRGWSYNYNTTLWVP